MNQNFENNEFFQQLPEETKEKLRNCKTEEEAMDVLKSDMIPIPDEVLDSVAGGDGWALCNSYDSTSFCLLDSCSKYDESKCAGL